jgi:hypothetical protein
MRQADDADMALTALDERICKEPGCLIRKTLLLETIGGAAVLRLLRNVWETSAG